MALEAAFGESYPVIAPFALEWMEEGRKEGRQEGAARIALLLLTSRFGEIEEPIQNTVRGLSIEQIEQLSEESRKFQSLDDLRNWLLQNTQPANPPTQV